jgi:hypothetical protein
VRFIIVIFVDGTVEGGPDQAGITAESDFLPVAKAIIPSLVYSSWDIN